jgi:hypothetical protein
VKVAWHGRYYREELTVRAHANGGEGGLQSNVSRMCAVSERQEGQHAPTI